MWAPREARRSLAPSMLTTSTPWGATTWCRAWRDPTRYAVATTTISNTADGATTSSTLRVASGTWSMAAKVQTRAMLTPRTGLWAVKGKGELGGGHTTVELL